MQLTKTAKNYTTISLSKKEMTSWIFSQTTQTSPAQHHETFPLPTLFPPSAALKACPYYSTTPERENIISYARFLSI